MMCACTCPMQEHQTTVAEYVQGVSASAAVPQGVAAAAARSFQMLKRSCKNSPRRSPPSVDEIEAFLDGRHLRTMVYFLGQSHSHEMAHAERWRLCRPARRPQLPPCAVLHAISAGVMGTTSRPPHRHACLTRIRDLCVPCRRHL